MTDDSRPLEPQPSDYEAVFAGVVDLLEAARRGAARAVNAVMTATYWEIGRRIVEYEQGGGERAVYGERLIVRLSEDLEQRYGRGFGVLNLRNMRRFYLAWSTPRIQQTASVELEPIVRPPAELDRTRRILEVRAAARAE